MEEKKIYLKNGQRNWTIFFSKKDKWMTDSTRKATTFMENSMACPQKKKLKIDLACNPKIPLQAIYLKEIKSLS